ncbi:hypothetical protein Y032_0003g1437 [Ancylostoma ceylanicum]|uniref:Sodium:neurotransmitter symporter family protein n=1 Tax=Ancylostoma ceylanicum TaxID=53326 RepID=A0A016VZI8_9BILA|nr:hypothetical protein Y032_0003g1437 [Ancylostoma ceylanicum]
MLFEMAACLLTYIRTWSLKTIYCPEIYLNEVLLIHRERHFQDFGVQNHPISSSTWNFNPLQQKRHSVHLMKSASERSSAEGSSTGSASEHERGTWNNQMESLLATISLTVGLGSLWRFPTLAYNNGGSRSRCTHEYKVP